MIPLTQEQARTLVEARESPPRVLAPQTQQVYFLVNGEVYARAQSLLEEEQDVLAMYPLLGELRSDEYDPYDVAKFANEDSCHGRDYFSRQ
jgi:hypothetical protein